jgi:hypothetical protein
MKSIREMQKIYSVLPKWRRTDLEWKHVDLHIRRMGGFVARIRVGLVLLTLRAFYGGI